MKIPAGICLGRNALFLSLILLPVAGPVALAKAPEAIAQSPLAAETPFLSENRAAMTKMMKQMSIAPSGDVDRDFVDMMTPHHQAAIEMAAAVLRYGHNERIRRIAQEIIVTQRQEIVAMRLAVGEPLPAPVSSSTSP